MDDYNKQSVFNAGVAQAERIDVLQRALNGARFNPQQFNPETETFNYQIMIDSLNGLMMECWSKAKESEQKEMNRLRNLLHDYIIVSPPIRIATSTKGEVYYWDTVVYQSILKLLSYYEQLIRDVLDAHGMNSPNRDDDDDQI